MYKPASQNPVLLSKDEQIDMWSDLFAFWYWYPDLFLDAVVALLRKTVLKSHSYHFEKHSLAYKFGNMIDKKKDDESHKYAEKADEMYNAVFMAQRNLSNSFTFTLSMLCLGIIIIISFVLIF